MCDKKHSRRFAAGLIDSFLTEEIIPDILIDVISGKKFLVCVHSQASKEYAVVQTNLICFLLDCLRFNGNEYCRKENKN